MTDITLSPARIAAAASQIEVNRCLDAKVNFVLTAGAGSGKTYSLIESLRHLIKIRGPEFQRSGKRVACITYTKVAVKQIISRVDANPIIEAATIHSFLWSVIRDFQPFIRRELPALGNWSDRLAEAGGVGRKPIEYNLGYPKVGDTEILLHHDDVLALASKLLAEPKFRLRLAATHPVIFIDEYQDTNKQFADALCDNVLADPLAPRIGLFGDDWQAIYDDVCGRIEHATLNPIRKMANFRSVPRIVNCLNHIRPDLPQQVDNETAEGTAEIFHTNDWVGNRRTGNHWEGDLPAEIATSYLNKLIGQLKQSGWDFDNGDTKILMLTHGVLANQQGYAELAKVFSNNDAFIKKEDGYVKFFAEVIEPACSAFQSRRFGAMFEILGGQRRPIRASADKERWANIMSRLVALRLTGSIGEVVDLLASQHFDELRIPDNILRREREAANPATSSEVAAKLSERWQAMKLLPYSQMIRIIRYIDDQTPFSIQHGVKGDEFQNVLVVIGRSWNKYNFAQFLELAGEAGPAPANKAASFERNRNLFYVACSRPKTRLALLFTQRLSPAAIATLERWFGVTNIYALPSVP